VTRIILVVMTLALLHDSLAASVFAQAGPVPQRERFEVSIGGLWIGGAGLGSTNAEIRANNLTPTPFRLFATETSEAAAPGLNARFAYWLSRSLAVEGGLVRVRPELRTRIDSDAESAAPLTAVERLDQYFIDAGVVWLLRRFTFGATVPFVSGGGGYLRQLHEGQTLVETGQLYQVGGGVRHQLFADAGWFRSIGARIDGRIYVLVDGVQLEDRPRTHGAFSGSLYLTF
jgi:hypothetical protein